MKLARYEKPHTPSSAQRYKKSGCNPACMGIMQDFLFHKYRESPSCLVELYGRDRDIILILQRCWKHLIRDVDAFIEKPGGKELSEAIHAKFKTLKEFHGKDQPVNYGRAEKAEKNVG